ncbi:MAG: spermidine synthase [bacterium JZ-2024 1]
MGEQVLLTLETGEMTVKVVQRGSERVLLFGHAEQSTMDLDDPGGGGFEYMDFFLLPCLLEIPVRKALFIGLGAGVGPQMYLARWPEVEVSAVEVNPYIVEIARDYFLLPTTPRLHIFVQDGYSFLRDTPEIYDVIVLDAYEHQSGVSRIPEHLTGEKFYGLVREHLSESGMALQNLIGHPYSEGVRDTVRTFRRIFRSAYLFSVKSSLNAIAVGSQLPALTKAELRDRARRTRCERSPRHLTFMEIASLLVTVEG